MMKETRSLLLFCVFALLGVAQWLPAQDELLPIESEW
jgi:hypothetical protein